MRVKLSLLFAGTIAAAAGAIALSAPSATATQRILCTDGTVGAVVTVGDRQVGGCIPTEQPCDPGPCTPPPTALAPR